MVASVVRMKSGAVGPWEASLRGGVAAEVALIECPPVEVVVATTCRTGETMMTWAHAGAPLHPREGGEEGVVPRETCPWDPHTTGEGEPHWYIFLFHLKYKDWNTPHACCLDFSPYLQSGQVNASSWKSEPFSRFWAVGVDRHRKSYSVWWPQTVGEYHTSLIFLTDFRTLMHWGACFCMSLCLEQL